MKQILFACQAILIAGAFLIVPMTAFATQSPDFGFSTNFPSFDSSFDFGFDDVDWDSGSGVSTGGVTSCKVLASAPVVDFGESVTISWETEGFDSIKIEVDGVVVANSGTANGQITFDNIQEDTTYRLVATNANGDTCRQTVTVGCFVPVTPPTCESFNITEPVVESEGNMTFSWQTTNVSNVSFNNGIGSVATVDGVNQTFTAPAAVGVYTYVLTFDGNTNNSCVDTVEVKEDTKVATVVAHKIVCTDEAQLPNWGAGGPDITASTAADWVAANNSCSFASGWEFEWATDQSTDPGDTLIGRAGSPWNVFGPTNANGRTQVALDLTTLTPGRIWFREVLQTGFIPFTHGQNGRTNVDNVSAEFYCDTDVINYDNLDFVEGLEKDQTYYCIAFNAPVVETPAPACVDFTATPETITLGEESILSWEVKNATQIGINNGVGDVTGSTSISVRPSVSTVYKLTVIGVDGTTPDTSCTVPVTVLPVPVCEDLAADNYQDPLPCVYPPATTPEITIIKDDTTNKDDTQAVVVGGTANFEIFVTNTGNEDLVNVVVTDPLEPSCNKTIGTLVVGASDTITCSTTNVQSAFTNVVNVTGDSAIDGQSVDDTDPTDVTVIEPAVFTCTNNVSFTASDTSIDRGQSSELTWSVTDADTVAVSRINATGLTGTETVSPTSDTRYVLTATKSGFEPIDCPLTVNVSTGGGGGGSSTPRCELDISDTKINRGDEITLTWSSSRARELILSDDRGNVLVTTEDKLNDEKDDLFDGEITLKPTRNTEYTLRIERGSQDRECTVDVEMDDEIVVLQTRDQAPLVAGISLTEVPYTGFEAGTFMTFLFYALLVAWALYITYVLVIPKTMLATAPALVTPKDAATYMATAEKIRPDVFSPMSAMQTATSTPTAPTAAAPANLPVAAMPATVEVEQDTVQTDVATDLENQAHLQQALLSSGAVQSLMVMTTEANRSETLKQIIADAKGAYPLEDGWVVINQTRLTELTSAPALPTATAVTGNSSLAEAIVTGNIVAAYDMIGDRPMLSLADAAADLDTLYRNRKGASESVSDLLTSSTSGMTDQQIADMIAALTGALDGTYTDEASAVKMAIMKAVKITA